MIGQPATRIRIALVGGSQLVQKLVGFLVIAIMTRHFPKEALGEYFVAVAVGAVAAQATELGTGRHLIRSVARGGTDAVTQLSLVLSLRVPVMLVAFAALNAGCLVLRPSLSPMLLVVSLSLLLQDLQFTYSAFFVGLERYRLRATLDVAGQAALAALTLAIARGGGELRSLVWAYVGAYAGMLALTTAVVTVKLGAPRLHMSPARSWEVARQSLPIFGVALLDTLHTRADTILLGLMRPLPEVAAYAAAWRLFEVSRLGIRPVALIFFPICVAVAARKDWPELHRLFRQLARTSLALGGAAGLVVIAGAGLLVPFVFGPAYAEAVPLVRLLFIGTPLLFAGLLAVALVHTLDMERTAIGAGLCCVGLNVALNALVIPRWGATGAALVSVGTQALWTVWLAVAVVRRLERSALPAAAARAPAMSALDEARLESVE